ncbi:MAG: HEAT repeat domain-containing protein [Planctomycetia bacterium]|nr:HEAT repeat domain-containing protein [Planctomycetia bacterium]
MVFSRSITRFTTMVSLLILALSIANTNGAEPAGSAETRIAKVKIDLKSDDPKVRQAAIGSLVHSDISPKLLSEMRAALDDREGAVRSTAATAIGNLGAAAIPAVPQLVAGLKNDPFKEARETAARALGRIGKAAPDEKSLVAPLRVASEKDADPVTRVVALGALAMIDVEVPQQITSLRKYLHHEEALVRMKAAHALGMLGALAKEAAPEIVSVLKLETDHHRRGYVARALGTTADPASLPALEAALKEESDPGAQGEMRGAIARLKELTSEKPKS